jgi:hypothetical protein
MYIYAVLDENGVCTGISELSGIVGADNMVQIPEKSNDYMWRKYENKQWSKQKFAPITDNKPSVEDMIAQVQSDGLVLMDAFATLYEKLLNAGVIS